MTRKDYEAVARIIRANRYRSRSVGYIASELAELFGETNPRFDTARFMEACGYLLTEEHGWVEVSHT